MQLKKDLQPLISTSQADFTANQSSNSLVITDTSANIRRIVEIVAALDGSLVGAADVKVFQLKYASAANAARLINDLFGDAARARGSSRDSTQGGDQLRFGFGGFGGFGGVRRRRRDAGGGRDGRPQSAGTEPAPGRSASPRRPTIAPTPSSSPARPRRSRSSTRSSRSSTPTPPPKKPSSSTASRTRRRSTSRSVINMLFNGGTSAANRARHDRRRSSSRHRHGEHADELAHCAGGLGSSGGSLGGGRHRQRGSAAAGAPRGGFGGGTGGFGRAGSAASAASAAADSSARLSPGSHADRSSALAGQVTVIADPDTNSLLVRT